MCAFVFLFYFLPVFCKYEFMSLTVYIILKSVVLKNKYIIYLKVIPCFQRDGLFCLHENGCITLRVRRSYSSIFTSNEEPGKFISHNNVHLFFFFQNYFLKLYVANTSQSMELMIIPALK